MAFGLSPKVISGNASEAEYTAAVKTAVKTAVIPVVQAFQTAINRSVLLETEKETKYFAIDTTELLRGDIKSRYEAYRVGLEANFLQIDEIRYKEDLKPLGMNYIKLGLNDVLFDPKANTIYTPNTNQLTKIGGGVLQSAPQGGIIETEKRYNENHDPNTGRFTSGRGIKSLKIGVRERTRLNHQIATDFPNLKADGTIHNYFNRNHFYRFSVIEFGQYAYHLKIKIVGNEDMIDEIRKKGKYNVN